MNLKLPERKRSKCSYDFYELKCKRIKTTYFKLFLPALSDLKFKGFFFDKMKLK